MVLLNFELCKTQLCDRMPASGHNNSSDNEAGSNSALLTASNLACHRGDNTLFKQLSFSLGAGECLHLIGANGSGKTSLLRILCGLNQADQGELQWRSEPTYNNDFFLSEVAYIGHKDGLKNELTALENLRFHQALDNELDEDKLDDCLAQLKILQCADLPAQALSFGQRRRLALAKLLLTPKSLWILDEPLTGIDVAGRDLIEQLCISHLQGGGSIIMTHHQSLDHTAFNQFKTELWLEKFTEPSQDQT